MLAAEEPAQPAASAECLQIKLNRPEIIVARVAKALVRPSAAEYGLLRPLDLTLLLAVHAVRAQTTAIYRPQPV